MDKIKTVGSTFMAAVGLMPDMRILDHKEESASYYMSVLAELVFALREKLSNINDNSYNNFTLRVGEWRYSILVDVYLCVCICLFVDVLMCVWWMIG